MTLAMVAAQIAESPAGNSVDKWKLYRALCEARTRLGITDRALALLNALLTFYPRSELSTDHNLVVFPSNAQLSARAHGMAEQTIRRHVAVLVKVGLISRKDSANGKRYARRSVDGAIDEAFGFNLAPLLARADEIEMLAASAVAERLALQRLKEHFTICRRDVAKLIATAINEGVAGDWQALHTEFRALIETLPRNPSPARLAAGIDELELLRHRIVISLEMQIKLQNPSANGPQNERHIQNSKSDSSIESEPPLEPRQEERFIPSPQPLTVLGPVAQTLKESWPTSTGISATPRSVSPAGNRTFPLEMVLRACPQISDYGPGGQVSSWRDLITAAVVVRSMFGISPSAYQEACDVMGAESAAIAVACILERSAHINSAGGYLRDLARRSARGEFSLGPMLMALLRAGNGSAVARVG